MLINEDEYLAHYGILRRSGRYPWGSGKDENTRNKMFLDYVHELKDRGVTEVNIARGMGVSTTELRAARKIAKSQQKQSQIALAQRLKDKGYSNVAIGDRMNRQESYVRTLLAPGAADKAKLLDTTADMLKKEIADKQFIDVGSGVENQIGVSKNRLDTAIAMLREDGYELHPISILQIGTGNYTNARILCPPGTTKEEVYKNKDKIQQITKFSDDGGRNYYGLHDPIKVDPKRVGIVYAEDGGGKADGVIYVRPGVEDIDLGGSNYAQVRVAVGDGHYLKGMAMYKDDLPEGTDLLFNTNQSNTGNKLDAMKKISDDPENPFKSMVRQIVADKGLPTEHVTSAMNIVNEEGKWFQWSRTLSSQILSKQSPELARSQLDMTYENRKQEHDDIMALTNPTVRKKLLEEFADKTDSASVHLKAAALPQQAVHVILPIPTLAPTQVYAPNYADGTPVVLIRHPHGGTFEIPELTVNNRHSDSRKILGVHPKDAIGIHHSVAERLSGADFDGDTVLVIPNHEGRIKTSPALKELKDFDPRASYPGFPGMKPMTNTQAEMGKISNLITDMSIQNAPHDEIARAVRHSMVVIDAEKHNLNHKLSYNDNNIKQLKDKYQSGGASTLISRAKAKVYVPHRRPRPMSRGGPVDPKTGEKVYEETGRVSYKTGKPRLTRATRLGEAKDAMVLSSGTQMERLYANHSNKLKALANQSRLEALNTPASDWLPSAKKTYAKEVESLDAKLSIALKNRPLERQAQLIASTQLRIIRDYNPNMDDDTYKKVKFRTLEEARQRTGSGKQRIEVTPKEWDAIQAGAISDSKLTQILNNADMKVIRELATPKNRPVMTAAKTQRAEAMLAMGYTRAEVAAALGVSVTTLDKTFQ
jgi:hypothetical protein